MRVAMLSTCAVPTPPLKYGGTELVVAELAEGLTKLGHDVTVFATGDSPAPRGYALASLFGAAVWPPDDSAEARHAAWAWREIARSTPAFDIVHVNHAAHLPMRAWTGAPTLLTLHHARCETLTARYVRAPDVAFVAISERQAALCPELPVVARVHHGLNPSDYPFGAGRGGYAAFLGRLDREKGPHHAIDAARMAGVPLRLAGKCHETDRSYYEREVEARMRAWPDAVLCGEHGLTEKARMLGDARALLFPIDWEEPFGLVMIEAMLVGTPVIAFRRGSVPEVVEEGVTGFVVDDVAQMAARLREIGRIDRVACRARALTRWSTERMAREYAGLYEQLIRAPQREPGTPRPHFLQGTLQSVWKGADDAIGARTRAQ